MLRMPTMKGGKTLLQYLFALTRGHGKLDQVKFYAPTGLSVTNGAIVIHTQRLKSDPGGNLLS